MVIFKRSTNRDLTWLDKDNNIFDENWQRTITLFGFIKFIFNFTLSNFGIDKDDNKKIGFK